MIRVEQLLREGDKMAFAHKPGLFQLITDPNALSPLMPLHRDIFMLFLTLLTLTLSTVLLWVELYLPKRYVIEVLTLGTCECIIWIQSITDVIQLK